MTERRFMRSPEFKIFQNQHYINGVKYSGGHLQKITKKEQIVSKEFIEQYSEKLINRFIQQSSNSGSSRLQPKQQPIEVNCPKLDGLDQENKRKILIQWLGQLSHKIFSTTYQLYKTHAFSQLEMKIYCSENFLKNIILLSKTSKELTVGDYQFINQTIKNDILNYYKHKYPPTRIKQANAKLQNQVEQIDNMDDLKQDLFFTSNLEKQFAKRYEEKSEKIQYYDLIMKFINYCLKLPDESRDIKSKSHYQQFQQMMTEIFCKVQDMNWMLSNKHQHKSNKQKTTKQIQQQEKYREKIRQYTNFKIGRKISQNVPYFSQQEIKNSDIKIKDQAVLRFLTKWLEQLQQNLDNIQAKFDNEENQSQKLRCFRKIANIKAKRQKMLKQIREKIYEQQKICDYDYLSSKKLLSFSENQGLVGTFSCLTQQNISAYVSKSLNSIIHDLCKLSISGFEQFRFPALACKVADLMRCQCFSKQKQILKIYEEIERISKLDPQKLKIIRVKNRLGKGTKDISINVLFNNTILCEIQLSINANQSLEKSLYSFNHYLYELQRSRFGPVSQLANVWSRDSRFQYFMTLLQTKNRKKIVNRICECKEQQMKQQSDPFRCSCCDRYYARKISFIAHQKCQTCKFWKCSNCVFDELDVKQNLLDDYSKKQDCEQLLKDDSIQSRRTNQQNKTPIQPVLQKVTQSGASITENTLIIPQYGVYVSKVTKRKDFVEFKRFDIPAQKNIYLVKNQQQNGNSIIHIIPKMKQKDFFKDKIVMRVKPLANLQKLQIQQFKKRLLYPTKIQLLYKKQGISIKLPNSKLTTMQFVEITKGNEKFENFLRIKYLILNNNKIKDLKGIILRFRNLEAINLRYNQIQAIPPQIQKLKFLQELNIGNNQITVLPNEIGQLKSLTRLNLISNKLTTLTIHIGRLSKLRQLVLQINKLNQVPSQIGQLINLVSLDLSENQLTCLPKQIKKLKSLTYLSISRNKITELPAQIGELSKLTKFYLAYNLLITLPPEIGQLQCLTQCFLTGNKINSIPKSIEKLKNLTDLYLGMNQLTDLDFQIQKLKSLSGLYMNKNELKSFVKANDEIKSIKLLVLSQNQLVNLPSQIGLFKNLQKLEVNSNKLQSLPKQIEELKNLSDLNVSNNQIVQILPQIGKLKSLTFLNLASNKLQMIPPELGQLKRLLKLRLECNQLTKLPKQIGQLKNLTDLYLDYNKFTSIPPQIFLLKRLKKLSLKENEIAYIPNQIQQLKNLVELDLSLNKIQYIPSQIGNLKNLSRCFLGSNQIIYIPAQIGLLTKLISLILQRNQLKTVPEQLFSLLQLQQLNLSSNQINVDKQFIQKIGNLFANIYLDGNNLNLSEEDRKWFQENSKIRF